MKLKPCPFCGFGPDSNDDDCIYPVTGKKIKYNDNDGNIIEYMIWNINCYETGGGCGVYLIGYSPEDCIEKWETRI